MYVVLAAMSTFLPRKVSVRRRNTPPPHSAPFQPESLGVREEVPWLEPDVFFGFLFL